jgi:hypothetical protein
MKKTLLLIISACFAISLIAQSVNEKPVIPGLQNQKLLDSKGLLATTQRLDSTISELTSNGGTTYTFSNRKRYSYSTVSLTTTTIISTSTSPKNWNSVWINNSKNETTVNGSGQPVLIITYTWNGITWVGANRTENVYTGANLTQTTTSSWNVGLNQWVGTARTNITYIGSSVDTEIDYTWDATIPGWVNSSKTVNTYTGGVLTSDITSDWDKTLPVPDWVNSTKTVYSYTGSNLMSVIMSMWDTTLPVPDWVNSTKFDYTYTGVNITLGILSNWVAGTPGSWSAAGKYEYTYDGNARLTRFIVSSSTNNGTTWTGLLRNDISYGTQGALNFITTIGFTWDALNTQFKAQARTTNWYSNLTTGIESVSEKTLNVYPNPAKDFVIFNLADMSESASVIIFNMQGQKVLEQKLSGNRQLDINSLPKGMYIFKLFNNGITHSGKLLKN